MSNLSNNVKQFIDKEYKFNINIEFTTRTELTPRIIEVSNAFGLGISEEKHFTIYKDFNIGFSSKDIVFITGDSGGGKSLLLKEIQARLYNGTLSIDDIIVDPESVIVESIGETLEEGIKYLSLMGLNDGFIFLRKYKELSDGQKYRFKLAKLISFKPKFIFIDEFCANLDRVTAKVIAYNLQRTIRDNDMILFAATTHRDIIDDLNPSVIVDKQFMDEVIVTYVDFVRKPISFLDKIKFNEGNLEDYKKLNKFHYKSTKTNFPYSKIVTAKYDNDLVGVVVFSPPFLQTKGRTIKFGKTYTTMNPETTKLINDLFIRGARYVISPKYRGCGLGQKLTLESLPFINNRKYLEVITAMGKYNPVFEKAGMEKIEILPEEDKLISELTTWFKTHKLRLEEIHNPRYFREFIDALSDIDKHELQLLTSALLVHPKLGVGGKDGKRATVIAEQKKYTDCSFEEVRTDILNYLPKLYTGMTLYYILENPYYKEHKTLSLNDFVK